MPRIFLYAILVISICCSLACTGCGDDPVSPPDDTTRPTVVSVSPANGATFVSVASDIHVTFSEAMDQNTLFGATLSTQPAVSGSMAYGDKILTFDPASSLLGDTTYTVTVTTAAKDKAGNALASPYVWQFSTDLDQTPPTVLSTSPLDGAVGVPVNSPVTVRFSENMDPATMIGAAFQLDPSTPGAVSYADSVLTFTPAAFLTGGVIYEATITTAAADTAGNNLASAHSWQFTTLDDTDPPTASITSPEDDAVVGQSTKITVAAADETGIDRVVFYIDGAEVTGSDDAIAPYEYTWSAVGLDTGSVHELTAEVFDVLGNSVFVDTVNVHYLWKLLITDDDETLIHRDLNEIHVRSDGTLLEFRVETFGGWGDYISNDTLGIDIVIYLDVDQNRSTGDTTASDGNPAAEPPGVIGINDIGADYRIIVGYHGDSLSSWNGTGWNAGIPVDLFNIRDSSNYFEVGVLRDRIGFPGSVDVVAFSYTLFKNPLLPGDPGTFKWDWAPNEGTGHATYVIDGSFHGVSPRFTNTLLPAGWTSALNAPRWPWMPQPFD